MSDWFKKAGVLPLGLCALVSSALMCSNVANAAAASSSSASAGAAASANSADTVSSPIKGGVVNKVYSAQEAPELTMATYNMGAARISNLDSVTQAIKTLKADIVALNEVDKNTKRSGNKDQAAILAKSLGMHYSFGRAIDFDGGEYGVALLSKYPIINSEVVPLPSGDPNEHEPRVVLVSEIDASSLGFESPIVVLTTHLDFKEDHIVNTEQVRALIDVTKSNIKLKHIKDVTTKIKILAGDLNDTYNSEQFKELYRYYNLVSTDNPNDMRTWPAVNPMADLDHIFTSRGQIWRVSSLKVLQGNDRGINWAQTSDHNPVITTLKLLEQ